jgi:prepilin peptidase CpaA
MDSSLTATAAAALPVILVWAAAVDILTRKIPNTVVLLLTACFAIFAVAAGMPFAQIAAHAACASAVLLFGFLLFSLSMVGGGDAKLLAAASLWFGFDSLLLFLASTALAGGVLSLAYLAVSAARVGLGQEDALVRSIPYGAAIAAGALAMLPDWLATL